MRLTTKDVIGDDVVTLKGILIDMSQETGFKVETILLVLVRNSLVQNRIYTQAEIGYLFDLSKERIRQLELKGIQTIGPLFKEFGLEDFLR